MQGFEMPEHQPMVAPYERSSHGSLIWKRSAFARQVGDRWIEARLPRDRYGRPSEPF
jgi:hypothetical protein